MLQPLLEILDSTNNILCVHSHTAIFDSGATKIQKKVKVPYQWNNEDKQTRTHTNTNLLAYSKFFVSFFGPPLIHASPQHPFSAAALPFGRLPPW